MAEAVLQTISSSSVTLFRIENRQGYAAVCNRHLTEGKSPEEAFERMVKALKRSGCELRGAMPPVQQ